MGDPQTQSNRIELMLPSGIMNQDGTQAVGKEVHEVLRGLGIDYPINVQQTSQSNAKVTLPTEAVMTPDKARTFEGKVEEILGRRGFRFPVEIWQSGQNLLIKEQKPA